MIVLIDCFWLIVALVSLSIAFSFPIALGVVACVMLHKEIDMRV